MVLMPTISRCAFELESNLKRYINTQQIQLTSCGMLCSVMQLLRPFIDSLKSLGYDADHLEFNADEMDVVSYKRGESDHRLDMKGIPREKRTAFDSSKLPKATQGESYYSGWREEAR